MKKEVIVLVLLGILLASPLVLAQEQAQTYSGFNKFVDNVKLSFSSGDKKVMLALDIREKELNSAINNLKSGEENKAKKEIESAINMLKIVQSKATPEISDEVKNNIAEIGSKINENLNLKFFEKYLIEEQKTKLVIEHSEKILEYCEELAKQDYELMLKDEKCQNNTPNWLEGEVNNRIKKVQKQDSEEIKKQVEISMNNPKNANCDEISLTSKRKECEKFKALAVKCEFQDDESACKEIGMFKDVQTNERENYEQEILNKYVPAECTAVGIKDGEECKKYIITLYNPESECMENGQLLDNESCGKKLVNEDKIPKDCIKNGEPMSPEECENIIKEKSKPSDKEIKVDLKECTDAGYNTKKECEEFLIKQNLPQECINAGALTPEACEKFKLPKKCQGQAFSNEECDAVFIKEKMPPECQESGTYDFFKCAKLLYKDVSDISIGAEIPYLESKGISLDEIPEICLDEKKINFNRSLNCDEALIKEFGIMLPPPEYNHNPNIPQPCIKNGTLVSPEECEEIMGNSIIGGVSKNLQDAIPKICQEANISTPEECGKLLEEQRARGGIGINMPKECIGLDVEECEKIMEEKNITIKKPEIEVEPHICCKKTEIGKEPRYRWEGKEEECAPSETQTAELVDEDFCLKAKDIDKDYILTVGVPEPCAKLGVYNKESCSLIMSKINAERIKDGDKIVVDKNNNTDVITNDEINKIVDDADKKSDDIKPDTAKADDIKQEVDIIEDNIKTIDQQNPNIDNGNNIINEPQKTKDNENVPPTPNKVDDNVAPGPQGIVGQEKHESHEDSTSSDSTDNSGGNINSNPDEKSNSREDSGGESALTGEVIGNSGDKESFLGKILKGIFGI